MYWADPFHRGVVEARRGPEDAPTKLVRGRRALAVAVQFVGPDVVEIEPDIYGIFADLFAGIGVRRAHLRFYWGFIVGDKINSTRRDFDLVGLGHVLLEDLVTTASK